MFKGLPICKNKLTVASLPLCQNNNPIIGDPYYIFIYSPLCSCKQWLDNCHRPDLASKGPEELHKLYKLCAKHFEPSLISHEVRARIDHFGNWLVFFIYTSNVMLMQHYNASTQSIIPCYFLSGQLMNPH